VKCSLQHHSNNSNNHHNNNMQEALNDYSLPSPQKTFGYDHLAFLSSDQHSTFESPPLPSSPLFMPKQHVGNVAFHFTSLTPQQCALAFVAAAGEIAESIGHHPDLHITGYKCARPPCRAKRLLQLTHCQECALRDLHVLIEASTRSHRCPKPSQSLHPPAYLSRVLSLCQSLISF
jgi:hypothetical protein